MKIENENSSISFSKTKSFKNLSRSLSMVANISPADENTNDFFTI